MCLVCWATSNISQSSLVACLGAIRESKLCAQLFLLLGIHFITQQLSDVSYLIQSSLKLNIFIRMSCQPGHRASWRVRRN